VNQAEAKEIAEKDLEFYSALSYQELAVKIGEVEHFERLSNLDETYQIEFQFFYDDSESQNIRVLAAVSYSGWTDFFPVSKDFIITKDGCFVGEK
jgi:hypothetical protein